MADELFEAAFAARLNAYAPYSGFPVGAALRTDDGRIFVGCNVENAAHPQGQCAEASAIGAMVSVGSKRIVEVLVVAGGDALISPCGGCRQRLAEFAHPATPVHLAGPDGVKRTITVGELLPLGFGGAHLTGAAPGPPMGAVDRLRQLRHADTARIAIQLGSGLGLVADLLEETDVVGYEELAGFPRPTVTGHRGRVVAGLVGGVPVLCLQGRAHLYEGGPVAAFNGPIRVLKALGIRLLILTNAAGAIADHVEPGEIVQIADHVNATGRNPLIGPNADDIGPRFPDMSDVYSHRLRKIVKKVADDAGIDLAEGVYLATLGPCFETPAEVRAFRALGADLVGMSTVPEAISARHAGLEVLGYSAVTNHAAGHAATTLSHAETLQVGAVAGAKLARLLRVALPEVRRALG